MIATWAALGLFLVLILVLLVPAVARHTDGGEPTQTDEPDLAIYRDQLAEVGAARESGLLSEEAAASARAEVERRMLAVIDRRGAAPAAGRRRLTPLGVLGLLAVVMVLSLGGYVWLGSPRVPDAPLAERLAADPALAEIAEMRRSVAQLEARLESGEGDAQGWILLGRSQQVLGRTDDALTSMRRAVELAGGPEEAAPVWLVDLAELESMATDGEIGPEARRLVERALERQPDLLQADYMLAVADAQAGDIARARQRLEGLLARSPEDAPWRSAMTTMLARLGPGEGQAPAASPPAVVDRAPDEAAIQAAADMTPEERQAFIRGMVERLQARVDTDPADREGWTRLVQAYSVLGDRERARRARDAALDLIGEELSELPADAPARAQLEAEADRLRGLFE